MFGDDLFLKRDEVARRGKSRAERLRKILLTHLPGSGLNHIDPLFGAGDHDVKIRGAALCKRRVEKELAVFSRDAHSGDGTLPRNVGEGEGERGTQECGHIRIVFVVNGEDGGHDLHFVSHPHVKAGTDGAVNGAGSQSRLFGGPGFALHEARAQDFAGGIVLLLVLHGEREKVPAIPRERAHDRGGKHRGVADADDH